MSEPTGSTIDGTPWEEPRGPHLPDGLTRTAAGLPLGFWVFAVAALIELLWVVQQVRLGAIGGASIGSILGPTASLAACLYGSALLWRHRRAWSTDRLLVIGLGLYAAGELLIAARVSAQPLLETLTPAADGEIFVPSSTLVLIAAGLASGVAPILVARGLLTTGPFLDDSRTRRWSATIAVLTVALVLTFMVGVGVSLSDPQVRFASGWLDGSLTVVRIVVAAVGFAGLGYLTFAMTHGWLGHSRPEGAWRVGMIAAWAMLAAALASNLVSLGAFVVGATVSIDADGAAIWTTFFQVVGALSTFGSLALLLAFVLGLPRETAPTSGPESPMASVASAAPPPASVTGDDGSGPSV